MRKLAVVFLLIFLSLAGCGSKNAPRQYFSYDVQGRADSLDPQFAQGEASLLVIQNCFEGLLRLDPSGVPENGVADEFNLSEDGRVYTFTISPEARWSDGSAVTADDFLFAFERIFSADAPSPYAWDFLSIENAREVLSGELPMSALGIRAEGIRRLVFNLSEPDSLFPTLLTGGAAMPCKRDFFTQQRGRYGLSLGALLTNGPCKISRWDSGRAVLHPDGNYRDPTAVESVTLYLGVGDRDGRFIAGRTDFLLTLGDADFGDTYRYDRFYDKVGLLIFNQRKAPYEHVGVRKALISVIDMGTIAEILMGTEGRYIADGLLPPITTLSAQVYRDLAGPPALPERSVEARALLFSAYKELDIATLPQTDLLLAEGADMLIGSSMQRAWQHRLSAYINLLPLPSGELERRVSSGDFQMVLLPIAGGTASPYSILSAIGGRDGENLTGGQIYGFEAQIAKAAADTSPSRAAGNYLAAEELILADFIAWPIYYTSSSFVSAPEVSGAYYLPQNGMVYFKDAVRHAE